MNKEKIIKESTEYTEIIKLNNKVKSKYFSIYKKPTTEQNKYGITIPKKIGHAIIRNKLKRQIKNIITTNEKSIQFSFKYVIILKEPILSLKYEEIECELLKLIKKVEN